MVICDWIYNWRAKYMKGIKKLKAITLNRKKHDTLCQRIPETKYITTLILHQEAHSCTTKLLQCECIHIYSNILVFGLILLFLLFGGSTPTNNYQFTLLSSLSLPLSKKEKTSSIRWLNKLLILRNWLKWSEHLYQSHQSNGLMPCVHSMRGLILSVLWLLTTVITVTISYVRWSLSRTSCI